MGLVWLGLSTGDSTPRISSTMPKEKDLNSRVRVWHSIHASMHMANICQYDGRRCFRSSCDYWDVAGNLRICPRRLGSSGSDLPRRAERDSSREVKEAA